MTDSQEQAEKALRGYDIWAYSLDGGTTANEDAMANALRALLEDHKRLTDACVLERALRALIPEVERLTAPPADEWTCDHECDAPSAVCIVDHKPLPAPPTDDEREGIAKALRPWAYGEAWPVPERQAAEQGNALAEADRVLASDVWRNRRRGLVTEAAILAGLNAEVKPHQAAPDLSYWGEAAVTRMRAVLEAARGADGG